MNSSFSCPFLITTFSNLASGFIPAFSNTLCDAIFVLKGFAKILIISQVWDQLLIK